MKSRKALSILSLILMSSVLTSCYVPVSALDGELSIDDQEAIDDVNACTKIYITNMAHEVEYSNLGGTVSKTKNATLNKVELSYRLTNRTNFQEIQTGTVTGVPSNVPYGMTSGIIVHYNNSTIRDQNPYLDGTLVLAAEKTYNDNNVGHSTGDRKNTFDRINCGKIIFATFKHELSVNDQFSHYGTTITEVDIEGANSEERSLNLARYARVIDNEILSHNTRSLGAEVDVITLSRSVVTNDYAPVVADTLNKVLRKAQSRGNSDANLPANVRKALTQHIVNVLNADKDLEK